MTTVPAPDPRDLATAYFDAWRDRQPDRLRDLLAPEATFRGPLGTADGVDACVEGLRGLAAATTALEVRAMGLDDRDQHRSGIAEVVTFFALTVQGAPPIDVANWSRVVDGRIAAVRVAFDPRPMLDG